MNTRRATFLALVAVAAALAAAPRAAAQTLEQRIARAPDGVVRISYPARPGVCGAGEGIMFRDERSGREFTVYRDWNVTSGRGEWEEECEEGPVHVNARVRGGEVTGLRAYVGSGAWGSGEVTTDLGMVPPGEAARWLLSLAESAPEEVGEDAVLPAVLARDAEVGAELLRLARAERVPGDTREQAVFWIGQVGDRAAVEGLQRLVADASVDEEVRENGIFSLSQTGEAEDAEFLRGLYGRLESEELKEKTIFAVSQTEGEEAEAWLLGVAENGREPTELREKAIFWATQSGASLAEMNGLYDRLDDRELKEQVIFGYSQRDEPAATDRLLEIARNDPDTELREKAVFWLGQAAGRAVTEELRGIVQDDDIDTEVREKAIFALSQRPREEAVPVLIDIARTHPNGELREKAMFWLAQTGDPRALDLFEEILRR